MPHPQARPPPLGATTPPSAEDELGLRLVESGLSDALPPLVRSAAGVMLVTELGMVAAGERAPATLWMDLPLLIGLAWTLWRAPSAGLLDLARGFAWLAGGAALLAALWTDGPASPHLLILALLLVFAHTFLGYAAALRGAGVAALGVTLMTLLWASPWAPEPLWSWGPVGSMLMALGSLVVTGQILSHTRSVCAGAFEGLDRAARQLRHSNRALEDARALASRRADQQRVLAELGRRALDLAPLDEAAGAAFERAACGQAARVLGEVGAVLLEPDAGGADRVLAVAGLPLAEGGPWARSVGDLLETARTGSRTVAALDHGAAPAPALLPLGLHAVVARPVDAAGRVLVIVGPAERTVAADERHFVAGVGHLLGAAARRAEDARALQAKDAQLRRVAQVEAVGRLAGGVAHDFNNLLTVILGYTTLLTQSLPEHSPERQDAMEVRTAAERGAGITRQLLQLARADAGAPADVELGAALRDIVGFCRRLVGEEISVELSAPEAPVWVHLDPHGLFHALLNLAANARDAMPRGGRLAVSVEVAPETVVVRVRDSGAGMDAATQARVFEPFFTTKPEGKGTGLGLAMVDAFLRRSGGSVGLWSQVGEGTCISMCFPRGGVGDAAKVADEARPAGGAVGTILVVEDDHHVRRSIAEALAREGYQTLEAADPREALTALARHAAPVDLLVTDYVMPHMSGVELARAARHEAKVPRVLYITGYAMDRISAEVEPEEGLIVLAKPFRPSDLLDRVRGLLAAAPPAWGPAGERQAG